MWPSPKDAAIILAAHAATAAAQCPQVHVFGARETTVASGYGSSGAMITLIQNQYPGTTAEAINYPACGGQSSCGDVSYAQSVIDGTNAVVSQVEAFNAQCPSTELILVGYSQGGQIMDNAVCGGGDSGEGLTNTAVPLSSSALNMIKAVILMGDPRWEKGLSYEVGTCGAGGFDARPAGFSCPHASLIQSYCDSPDPYCCNGNNAAYHQTYVSVYGSQALSFIEGKLGSSGSSGSGGGGGGSPPPTTCSALYGQCGGIGWTGPTCCSSGTCKESNAYYSQCL